MNSSKQYHKRTILDDSIFDDRITNPFFYSSGRASVAIISVRILRSEPPPIGVEIIQVLGLKLQPQGLSRANGELAIELGVKRVGTMLQM